MRDLRQTIKKGRLLRAIGFDDAPFEKPRNGRVSICGVICAGTRFEGMLWGEIAKDGDDATDVIATMVTASKFYPQLHLVLLDGIAMGGFNVVNLKVLSHRLQLPCIAVMRRKPDMDAVIKALKNFDDHHIRTDTIEQAGEIYQQHGFVFQAAGCASDDAAVALERLTDKGKVPEVLRLAHLIGAAVKTGESGSRA